MPRIKVSLPDPILQIAADQAHAAGRKIDDLYAEAITAYVERNKTASPGSLKSSGMPRSAIKLTIEIPEALFEEAEKLAKRLGKRRDVLYAEALAKHVKYDPNAGADDNHGHGDGAGLPSGRWQSSGSG